MAVHSFQQIQRIPASLPEVWKFFSDPANLGDITPAKMKFRTVSKFHGNRIYAGQIIEYTLTPLLGIKITWMTEITHVNEPFYFVDEQRKGPYSLWHHQHHFKEIEGGVEMRDIVHYKNPLGPLGRLANILFVKKELEAIFAFRENKIEEVFGKWSMTRSV